MERNVNGEQKAEKCRKEETEKPHAAPGRDVARVKQAEGHHIDRGVEKEVSRETGETSTRNRKRRSAGKKETEKSHANRRGKVTQNRATEECHINWRIQRDVPWGTDREPHGTEQMRRKEDIKCRKKNAS